MTCKISHTEQYTPNWSNFSCFLQISSLFAPNT
jgi:hypothetical protein